MCRDLRKDAVDDLATSFVVLAAAAGCFHPSWLLLTVPCLCGVRQPTPFSVAVQQSYLMQQSSQWAQAMLSPFFARMVVGKMKRKRAMKEADLIESFETLVELVTSDEAISVLPRNVHALAGLLWTKTRNLGMDRATQIDVVADFYFQRLVYPVLLVPDQFGLVDGDRVLGPLVRKILQGIVKCVAAAVFQVDLSSSPFAYMAGHVKSARARMFAFVEKLVVDPLQKGWGDFVDYPAEIVIAMEQGDSGLGVWLNLMLQRGGATQNAELKQLMAELDVVGSELERRQTIESVVNEEKDFTLRMDGVSFWLRDFEYGLMVEGTALRMANEWLKKVNQLRAVLRISLNKRTHYTQWNGKISDLVDAADFAVFAEFAKVLRSVLPIVANSVNQSLERAILAYKQETQRDPLRDLVAVSVHGKTLLTRLSRLPPALKEEERIRLAAVLEKKASSLNDLLTQECSEIVRLHQMQSSFITGWSSFPRELVEQSGLVKAGRTQLMYGKVAPIQPATIKTAKYAMLLSDVLILLGGVSADKAEGASSARDREECFGGGNAFQMEVGTVSGKGVRQKTAQASKMLKGIDVCFRIVGCMNLAGARLKLKPSQNAFVVNSASGAVSFEMAVTAAQKMEWITAWSNVTGMEHNQKQELANTLAVGIQKPGEPGFASPRSSAASPRSKEASPKGSPSASPRPPPVDDDDIDEIEALMALGMYDTAVLKKPDAAPTEEDNNFLSMVGQLKRRDGKARISLEELFQPPPGLLVKVWKDSLRHMAHPAPPSGVLSDDEAAENELSIPAVEVTVPSEPTAEETEEMQLRAMMAHCSLTLRFARDGM